MTITAAIITLNEEANITSLLRSLAWADEVVVIDGGSQDRTVELARAGGARVFEHPFDNYAAQRNRAIAHAHGTWILSIDADERPVPAMADELRRLLPGTRRTAFRVPIRSSIFGRPMRFSGTQGDRPIRLFRRGSARWSGSVHEVLEVAGRVGMLHSPLTHVTLPTLASFFAKMQRYTTLEAQSRVEAGIMPRASDRWIGPAREIFRRLIWKWGCFDGPQGWAFCLLSGLSEWVLADKHRKLWLQAHAAREPHVAERIAIGSRANEDSADASQSSELDARQIENMARRPETQRILAALRLANSATVSERMAA